MIVLALASYFTYMSVVFGYIAEVFDKKQRAKQTLLYVLAINLFLPLLPLYVTHFRFEPLLMLLYTLALFVEVKFFLKSDSLAVLFGTMSFVVNFFAMRSILMGVFSLVYDTGINSLLQDAQLRLILTCLNFFILIPYILMMQQTFSRDIMDLFLANRRNVVFSSIILVVIFINQLIHMGLSYQDILRNSYLQIRTGVFSIILYGLMMVCVYVFSKLSLTALHYGHLSEELRREQRLVEKLEASSRVDTFTGLLVRSVALEKLDELLAQKEPFFLVFFDIDGLKFTNDTFGHEEGDFYIQKVSSEIKHFFYENTVSRLGGDEFLVLGTKLDNYEQRNRVLKCIESVKQIQRVYDKPYMTSLSYGRVNVDKSNQLSAQELLDLADRRMYEHKRRNKRQRSIVALDK